MSAKDEKLLPTQSRVNANRNVTIATTSGRTYAFEKNVPQIVPKHLVQELLTHGIVPVDDEDLPVEAAPPEGAPTDPHARQEAIKKVILELRRTNNREDFTAAGAPKVSVIERRLGWSASSKEIAPVLQQIFDEEADKKA